MLGDQLRASRPRVGQQVDLGQRGVRPSDVSAGASAFPGERYPFQFRFSWPPQRQRAAGH